MPLSQVATTGYAASSWPQASLPLVKADQFIFIMARKSCASYPATSTSPVGHQTRRCGAGDVVIVPTDTPHGFTTITETTMEVVAELDAGQVFPVRAEDGTTGLVEVYRSDMPWSRQPPPGFDWTSDTDVADILIRASDSIAADQSR